MSTVIKRVEQEDIVLNDCEVSQFSWKIFVVLIFIIGISVTYLYFNNPFPSGGSVYQSFFTTIAFMGILGSTTIIITTNCNISVPGYRVWILGDYDSEKYIKKSTSEQDQKEVCRVVRELEPRCREIAKKERELERIAQGCK